VPLPGRYFPQEVGRIPTLIARGMPPRKNKRTKAPLCATIGETILKFFIKLEGLENFDVGTVKKS
jgi:hypothetical protein